MQNTEGINCPYCGRWFNRVCDYKRHDIYSIISCVTKIKIAENDKIHRERLKAEYKEKNPTLSVAQARRRMKWYEKHKERILQEKKDFYQQNKDKFHEYYEVNKEKLKERYEANKEKILEKQKIYRKNKKMIG
jgi:hypothetical protein